MAVETQTCVLVKCDGCGTQFADLDEENRFHFDTEADALKTLVGEHPTYDGRSDDEDDSFGWSVERTEPDGSVLWRCKRCTDKRRCEAEGHEWTEWSDCWCGGRSDHPPGKTIQRRGCGRYCGATEKREVDGKCQTPPAQIPLSRGAQLVQHRANYVILHTADPERYSGTHEVPEEVADLVAQGAEIVRQIDERLPADYTVR